MRQVAGECLVANALARLLQVPVGEGVGGSGDHREPMLARKPRDCGAQGGEVLRGLRETRVDACADFDLRAQELNSRFVERREGASI